MKKLLISIALLFFTIIIYAQDFFREDFSRDRSYVILANPTAGNLAVISFLIEHKLLDINMEEVNFVGVYHEEQDYDFSRSTAYIHEKGLKGFFLHEVRGKITEEDIYRENECSADFRKIFENSVGIIFFGGADIPPAVYGEDNLYSETEDPERHYFETSLQFHLLGGRRNQAYTPLLDANPGYLVTGFCLGMQTMNVATGGTLYQDIPAQIYGSFTPEEILKRDRSDLHRNYWQEISNDTALMGINLHRIQFTSNPFFGNVIKLPGNLKPLVYSSHHQAVSTTGEGLEVTALSSDGRVVEGLVHIKYPNVFAVQFHPEVPALYEDRAKVKFNPDDEPLTLHQMMDRKSLRFHKEYWGHISAVIRQNAAKN